MEERSIAGRAAGPERIYAGADDEGAISLEQAIDEAPQF